MILRFRNLGIIEEACIDVSKPFILFVGPNGTGKTYLSYAMTALPQIIGGHFFALSRGKKDNRIDEVFDPSCFLEQDSLRGPLKADVLFDLFKNAVSSSAKSFLSVLNVSSEDSTHFSMEVVSSLEEWREELYNMQLDCGFSLKLNKIAGSFDYSINRSPYFRIEDFKKEDIPFEQALFLTSIFFSGNPSASMLTAERTGILLFSKEIALSRLKGDPSKAPRYPLAISDGLVEAEDRAHSKRVRSEFYDLANEIESSILHGQIKVNSEGELLLKEKDSVFQMSEASSTVKALGEFIFYIRYKASKMARLVIDEPEIHLHPDNQILLTRVFSKMVNRGLQLIISTHSDYIIREINNLIMLHNAGHAFQKQAKAIGYKSDESLDCHKIQPYLFSFQENGRARVEPIAVTEKGFSVSSIDGVISRLNEASEQIYCAMLENI